MALYKVGYTSRATGSQGIVYVGGDVGPSIAQSLVADAFGEAAEATEIDMRSISGADTDGSPLPEGSLQIEGEDGEWFRVRMVTQWPDDEAEMYGTDDDLERFFEAQVDSGYRQVAAEIAADESVLMDRAAERTDALESLDEDDLARIANALQLAFDTGLYKASKVQDRDMAEVMRGIAKAYGQTMAKVERLLDGE